MRPRDQSKEEAIRQKAVEIIVKDGFDGLSMHKLARAAGVSPATIYIYFRHRDDLILQVGVSEELKMFEASLKGFNPDMSFEEGLRVQWMNRARYFLDNPQQMHFMEQLRYSRFNDEIWRQAKSGFSDIMSRFVHKAIRNGELVKLPLEVFWSVAYAPLYQLVKFHVNGRGMQRNTFVLKEEDINLTLSLVLKGLKP
ncbi:MAG: TetR family transcriptional regulator [Owenweeksia sp.]|nr:TetR family transcriptional regulator [Owenweeksia sp.]MBF97374.1 TetR family transcriptional regulator [Owenweeksia sp.]|tara:strand:+ start:429 stop:1019 length:591 start_codon:yes stop_codon:yes gene_type:complete